MSGIIKLLSDAVANQIAAGEVVQRPSSIVKELLENSIDAGATNVKLLIKDGGSTLVQVIDNGKGMSETDARLCWERHATSKIKRAEDLFQLKTYGFRGEAMASIAAVAQVEMKTRRKQDEVGTYIRIEASECLEQSICSTPIGTSIAVKNVFFNIPARRNFLKSPSVETKHIYEEFQRQAMANPHIAFQLYHQNQEVFDFPIRPLKERIAEILGRKKIEALIDLNEHTEIIRIHGFIGTPDLAKKTRGDQFFFVNERFIKSSYFHHAVAQAFEGILEKDSFPTYVLFFEIDPAKVDVNVHPTKTEVKFEDEKHIYQILKAAARKALNQYLIPQELSPDTPDSLGNWLQNDTFPKSVNWQDFQKNEKSTQSYNPFPAESKTSRYQGQDWQKILGPIDNAIPMFPPSSSTIGNTIVGSQQASSEVNLQIFGFFNLGERYLVANVNQQLYVIDIKRAQQHQYFLQYHKQLSHQKGASQQLLFPRNVELQASQLAVFLELTEEFKFLGFDLGHFGGNTIIVNGVPAALSAVNEQEIIEQLISDYETSAGNMRLAKNDALALSMSRQNAKATGKPRTKEEMEYLVRQTFDSASAAYTFDGKQIYITVGSDSIFELFNKNKRL